jgi:GNAT superfamily N-acetyltransferase
MNTSLVTVQLRYMATDFDVQGRGYGARVLATAEEELRSLGVEQIWANGRDTALGFYENVGWQRIEGSEHLSPETMLPHTVIFKRLDHDEAAR